MNKFVNDESNEADCEVTDMLKNVLIVVDDIEKSIEFYRDLLGLQSFEKMIHMAMDKEK